MYESILHPKFRGLIMLSGLQGIGKSTLAFTLEVPDRVAILDFDTKGEAMADDYGIEHYYAPDFMADGKHKPEDYDADRIAEWTMSTLMGIPDGITTVVMDNATFIEAGLTRLVEKEPRKFGLNAKNVVNGVYGGANPGVSLLWQNTAQFLQARGVKCFIAVNHMAQPWANGAPVPNRYHIKGNKVFRQLSILTLLMVPGDPARGGQPPVPSALVIKEMMALRKFDPDTRGFTTKRTLPYRIPVADWKRITGYFDSPADFQAPTPGEAWSDFEVSAYGEFLSDEQIKWIETVQSYSPEDDGAARKPAQRKPETDPLATDKARLIAELVKGKHYANGVEIAAKIKELGLAYTKEGHDEIRARLIAAKNGEKVIA